MAERPKLVKVDPEMQRWCALLEAEVSTWPNITCKPMFGLGGYYRGRKIFAAIPRTRAMETPFSLLIKTADRQGSARMANARGPGAGWHTFTMESDADIPAALKQLGRAYEQAGRQKVRSSRRGRK